MQHRRDRDGKDFHKINLDILDIRRKRFLLYIYINISFKLYSNFLGLSTNTFDCIESRRCQGKDFQKSHSLVFSPIFGRGWLLWYDILDLVLDAIIYHLCQRRY